MNKSLGDALAKYDSLSSEVKILVHVLYTRLKTISGLRKTMRGPLDGVGGAFIGSIIMAMLTTPVVAPYYPVFTLKIEFLSFLFTLVGWALIASFVNYFFGWRKYKPTFDQEKLEFKLSYRRHPHKYSLAALKFINEFFIIHYLTNRYLTFIIY